jgi:Zn finger protein HypA/HybF involved in hydrogenase expression
MKKCPSCNSEVDDNFELCWNCQYSFAEDKALGTSDFKLICPRCNGEIMTASNYCPHCYFDLREINKANGTIPQAPRQMDCLRCKVPLDYQGNYKFTEYPPAGSFNNLFQVFINRESFDFYSCPSCGKVEFFLPGFD